VSSSTSSWAQLRSSIALGKEQQVVDHADEACVSRRISPTDSSTIAGSRLAPRASTSRLPCIAVSGVAARGKRRR